MTTQRRTLVVDDAQLADLRRPRSGVLLENQADEDRFELAEGPFSEYLRTLAVEPASEHGQPIVTEKIDWELAIPVFWVLFWLPVRRYFAKGQPLANPWWAPAGRLDARASHVIGLLGVLAIVNGYLGTVIGQTITFAADEFCDAFEITAGGLRTCVDSAHDKTARANILSLTRVAIVLSLVLTIAADRIGRKRAMTIAVTASCAATALGALAPSIGAVAATQVVARGLATGLSILIAVFAAEELPPRSRAYGVSLLVLLAGLGSGMVVWVLPAADLADWGWRIVYALGLGFLPVAIWAARRLPTTRRFDVASRQGARRSISELWSNPLFRNRLLLLASGALLATIFSTPASQFDNQFLRDELGYSATKISLFTVVTSTPIGLGVMAGGVLADRLGRRPIGALGTLIGALMTLLSFFSSGGVIWVVRAIGVILGAGLAIPALTVYGPELFPTRLRSSANGIIVGAGVAGSVIGLQLVGRLAERWDSFGPALSVALAGPLILVVMIVSLYPETANRTLEEINGEPELGAE